MRWRIVLFALVILVGAAAWWLFLLRKDESARLRQARLPDGTYAQIEALTFGKSHTFTKGNALMAKLHSFAPDRLKKLFKPPFSSSFTLLEEDALVIWYNRYDPATATYPPANLDSFKIIDEHGCVFPISYYGGGGATPVFSIAHARAGVFPRRQKAFRVRAQSFPVTNIEWVVENPFVTNPAAWKPEPLPLTCMHEGVAFTLEKIAGHFYASGSWFEPKFKIVHDGVDRTEWYKPRVTFMDATGNQDNQRLCPYEPAWKLEVDFYKSHKAPFAEDQIWRGPEVLVPRSGEVISLGQTGTISGVSLRFLAFCGPGEFSFSNNVCISSAEWAADWQGETSSSSSSGDGRVEIRFRHKEATLLLQIDNLKRSEDLLVRLGDEQDRSFAADFRGSASGNYRYGVKVPTGAQRARIEVIPQKPPKIEYIVKPPAPKT